MNIENWAAVAGIGGIAIGAATLVFRDIIAKKIFVTLPARYTYRLLRLIVICAFALGLVGAVGWIWLQSPAQARAAARTTAEESLDTAYREVAAISTMNRSFVKMSFENYSRNPTLGNWAVVQTDLK